MIEKLHSIGTKIRHSRFIGHQHWLWQAVDPVWQAVFERISRKRGFVTAINGDTFHLTSPFFIQRLARARHAYASRYARPGKGSYEPDFYLPFVSAVKPGMTVLDVGAHVGFFSLGAACRIGPSGRLFCFEPAPETRAILQRHLQLNKWDDRTEIIPAAVSDCDGQATFFAYHDSMAASFSRENVETLNPQPRKNAASRLDVPTVSLDRFCADRSLAPDVIKIDVEGAELLVLKGARDLLRSRHMTIFCEVHPQQMKNCGSSLDEFRTFLAATPYQLLPLDEPGPMGIFHCKLTRYGS